MAEVTFDCGNIPIAVATKVLGMDWHTIRFLLQNGAVDWEMAEPG